MELKDFRNVVKLSEYIEREADKRLKWMVENNLNYDEYLVLQVFMECNAPLSEDTIFHLTKIPRSKICKKLCMLRRKGFIQKATVTPVTYWRIKKK